MTIAADNVTLALRLASPNPGDWLARSDAADHATFTSLVSRGHFTEACDFMLAQLARTEVTRTHVHGPAPTWDQAVAAFTLAVDRQQPAQIATISALIAAAHDPHTLAAGESTPPADLSGLPGPRDRRTSPPAVSPIPSGRHEALLPGDVPTLAPVPGPTCGHVHENGRWVCQEDNHPANPGGHVYYSLTGSDVADRHTYAATWPPSPRPVTPTAAALNLPSVDVICGRCGYDRRGPSGVDCPREHAKEVQQS